LVELEREIVRLRDIEEIRQLQAKFWLAADGNILTGPTHEPETIADLFTEDGIWELAGVDGEFASWSDMGPDGRSEMLAWFRESQCLVPFAMHFGVCPIINVNGRTADACWKVLATMTTQSKQALWSGGLYEVAYLKTHLGWRIRSVRVTVGFNTPFEGDGWGAMRYAPLARNAAPD
jgi:hypothetical protein